MLWVLASVLTKGNGKYKPSSLLTRVIGQKSRNRVIRSMKKFAPDTEDSELIQQLDIVTVNLLLKLFFYAGFRHQTNLNISALWGV